MMSYTDRDSLTLAPAPCSRLDSHGHARGTSGAHIRPPIAKSSRYAERRRLSSAEATCAMRSRSILYPLSSFFHPLFSILHFLSAVAAATQDPLALEGSCSTPTTPAIRRAYGQCRMSDVRSARHRTNRGSLTSIAYRVPFAFGSLHTRVHLYARHCPSRVGRAQALVRARGRRSALPSLQVGGASSVRCSSANVSINLPVQVQA